MLGKQEFQRIDIRGQPNNKISRPSCPAFEHLKMSENLLPYVVYCPFACAGHEVFADEGEETFQKKYPHNTGA